MSKRKSQFIIMCTVALFVFVLKIYNVPANIHKPVQSVVLPLQVSIEEVKNEGRLYKAVRAVDGDTIKIMVGDKEETVRLIGIDTPESVDPRTTVECFGHEASNKMKELIKDKNIYLVKDTGQPERDKYGRLLGYVFLEDGTFINEKMIKDGYAFEYTYNIPYKYQKDFKSAESLARASDLGLWNKSVCDYRENPKKSLHKTFSKKNA